MDKVNNNSCGEYGGALSRQSIAPWLLESKLNCLVAKVLRTYQREYRKHSQRVKESGAAEPRSDELDELRKRHKKMLKAATDLFIDQVREKIGPYGGAKLKSTFVEHLIVKH